MAGRGLEILGTLCSDLAAVGTHVSEIWGFAQEDLKRASVAWPIVSLAPNTGR